MYELNTWTEDIYITAHEPQGLEAWSLKKFEYRKLREVGTWEPRGTAGWIPGIDVCRSRASDSPNKTTSERFSPKCWLQIFASLLDWFLAFLSFYRRMAHLFSLFFLIFHLLSSLAISRAQASDPVPPLQWINLTGLLSGSAPPPLKDTAVGYDETRLDSLRASSFRSTHRGL